MGCFGDINIRGFYIDMILYTSWMKLGREVAIVSELLNTTSNTSETASSSTISATSRMVSTISKSLKFEDDVELGVTFFVRYGMKRLLDMVE